MKLTMQEVQDKMAAAWKSRAVEVPCRISGNRYVYAVTDHGDRWMPLDTSWGHGRQVFEPADGTWSEPNPVTYSWAEAVMDSYKLALADFTNARNRAAVKRLPRAQVIADGQNWH